jgi:protein-L-isoaspartate O-methyltransferase
MVVPVGPSWGVQKLKVFSRDEHGRISRYDLLDVGFVPMVSTLDEWQRN